MMNKKVLIIDDDISIRKIVEISLKAIAGWEVVSAGSGQEGLQMAQTEQPDAILLDVMMPGMDGITTLNYMQANSLTQSIPTILLTAKVSSDAKNAFAELPIVGVITKPFKAPDLVENMISLLNWDI